MVGVLKGQHTMKDMNQQAIDDKLAETRSEIVKLYPNSCTSCSGRGGRVYPSYEGCYDITPCGDCTLKGLDPLDMTKELVSHQYDEELLQEWREEGYDPYDITNMNGLELEDYYKQCSSPTNNQEIMHGCWEGLPSKVQDLLTLKDDLNRLRKRYANLLSEDMK